MKHNAILLKLTGEIFSPAKKALLSSLLEQIKELANHCHLAIVMGGGNIWRGEEHGKASGITPAIGHEAGMLATMINGLLIQDMLTKYSVKTSLLSAIVCPQIVQTASQANIDHALSKKKVIVFSGGIGSPFFTTDTNMIIRALQIGATQVWKGTDVEGVYTSNPALDKNAKIIKKITYSDAISKKLGILDTTALVLAEKHNIKIRVFNVFQDGALIKAWQDNSFGSVIN